MVLFVILNSNIVINITNNKNFIEFILKILEIVFIHYDCKINNYSLLIIIFLFNTLSFPLRIEHRTPFVWRIQHRSAGFRRPRRRRGGAGRRGHRVWWLPAGWRSAGTQRWAAWSPRTNLPAVARRWEIMSTIPLAREFFLRHRWLDFTQAGPRNVFWLLCFGPMSVQMIYRNVVAAQNGESARNKIKSMFSCTT